MSRNKKTMQFLSQPVILEESGIPMLNGLIIISVFIILTSFIVWSVLMEMDEVTTTKGVLLSENGLYEMQAIIQPEEIGNIKEGLPVKARFNKYDSASGIIADIALSTEKNEQGLPYYEITVELDQSSDIFNKNIAVPGMSVSAEIITGSRTMFEYLLTPILAAKDSAFKEN